MRNLTLTSTNISWHVMQHSTDSVIGYLHLLNTKLCPAVPQFEGKHWY